MSANITIDNYPAANLLEATELAADSVVGAISLAVRNNQGYAINDSLLVGTPGSEGSEIATVASVDPSQVALTVSALKLKHLQHDRIVKLFGTQAKIYRAPNQTGIVPDDSQFTLQATVTLEPDQPTTTYTDNAGSDGYWYKFTYFNPTSSTETNRLLSTAIRGDGPNGGEYCDIAAIREEAGFKNATYITDPMINVKRQAAQAEIDSALGGYYQTPFKAPINPFIGDITRRLAAGLLLLEQFGAYDTLNTNNGQKKVDAARADYQKLMAGSMTLKDSAGSSLATDNGAAGFSAWPNDTTPIEQSVDSLGNREAGSGDFLFRINDRY